MSLPALLSSIAVIAHSLLFSSGNQADSTSTTSPASSSNRSTDLAFGESPQRIFLAGIVTGIGVFWIANWQGQKLRLVERLRLSLWNWGHQSANDRSDSISSSSDGNVSSAPPKIPAKVLRKRPVLVQQLEPTSAISNATNTRGTNRSVAAPLQSTAQRVVVVSPYTAPTSALSVVLLTLPPGTELARNAARGVEFYYVLQGNGLSHVHQSRSGEATSVVIRQGQGWVVDPGKLRWISNPSSLSSSADLIILRAADDGGWAFERKDLVIPAQSSSSTTLASTAADFLASGLKQLESMVKSYRTMKESDNSKN